MALAVHSAAPGMMGRMFRQEHRSGHNHVGKRGKAHSVLADDLARENTTNPGFQVSRSDNFRAGHFEENAGNEADVRPNHIDNGQFRCIPGHKGVPRKFSYLVKTLPECNRNATVILHAPSQKIVSGSVHKNVLIGALRCHALAVSVRA